MSDFNNKDLGFGKVAEILFKKYYRGVGNGKQYRIRDTSDKKYHRKIGVDFEVVARDEHRQKLIEVKHQRGIRYTDDIILETLNEYDNGRQLGWFRTSQADEMYILESKTVDGIVYPIGFHCFNLKALRRLIMNAESIKDDYINVYTKAYKVWVGYLKRELGTDYWYEDLSQYGICVSLKTHEVLEMGNKKRFRSYQLLNHWL